MVIFRKQMRHINRYREIAVTLSKNGFGFMVKELGLDQIFTLPRRIFVNQYQEKHRSKNTPERIRSILEDLGPAFIKMGQLASSRPDLIPKDLLIELEQLQDQLSAVSFEKIKEIIEEELKAPISEIFSKIDKEPLGVASIGQVHKAVLWSGEEVAVKIQRPNVDRTIQTDLEILQELAERAERRLKWASKYQLKEIIDEFSQAIINELDFMREGRNADLMAQQFEGNEHIKIPAIYWNHSTAKVLTMEYIEGIKINDPASLEENGYSPESLAESLVHATLFQIFKKGFFHADPHTGNIVVLPGDTIAFLDFGMVGRLSSEMKTHLASLLIGMYKQDTEDTIKAITKMGIVPEKVNRHDLEGDVELLQIKYYHTSISEISLGEVITDLFSIANKHQINIPTDLTLVGKTLLTMEGTIEPLYPDLNVMEAAAPFGREMIRERYHPKRIAEDIFSQLRDYGDVARDMPELLQELSSIIKKRKVPVEISIPEAKSLFSKMDTVSNRLAFSIVLLAFSLIMVGLIIGSALGRQSSLLWDIPAVEIGFIVAMAMFSWLIYSIFRSGRF